MYSCDYCDVFAVEKKQEDEEESKRKKYFAKSLEEQYSAALNEKRAREAEELECETRLAKMEVDLNKVREKLVQAES